MEPIIVMLLLLNVAAILLVILNQSSHQRQLKRIEDLRSLEVDDFTNMFTDLGGLVSAELENLSEQEMSNAKNTQTAMRNLADVVKRWSVQNRKK